VGSERSALMYCRSGSGRRQPGTGQRRDQEVTPTSVQKHPSLNIDYSVCGSTGYANRKLGPHYLVTFNHRGINDRKFINPFSECPTTHFPIETTTLIWLFGSDTGLGQFKICSLVRH
jgi:hypothetical protein